MRKKKFTRNVGVLLSEETYKELLQVTDRKEISFSEFIRELIKGELKNSNKGGYLK